MSTMWKEFKTFAIKGNMIDMAVGIIIGASFNGVVQSLTNDIIMPILSPLTGDINFANAFYVIKAGKIPPPYTTLQDAKAAGATLLSYGNFLNMIINFMLVAFALFLLVKYINKLKRPPEETAPAPAQAPVTVKECPFCFTEISIQATRCPHCTSELTK